MSQDEAIAIAKAAGTFLYKVLVRSELHCWRFTPRSANPVPHSFILVYAPDTEPIPIVHEVAAALRALPDRDKLPADLLLDSTYLLTFDTLVDIVRHVLRQRGIHA
jgi:hypothetical protein